MTPEQREILERTTLYWCERTPKELQDYPDGVSCLIEYRDGRPVNHYIPHTAATADLIAAVVPVFVARTARFAPDGATIATGAPGIGAQARAGLTNATVTRVLP